MNIAVSAPASPLSGTVTVNVAITGHGSNEVTRVELWVDNIPGGPGVLKATDTSAPWSFSLNTTTIQDGSHFLTAKAYFGRNSVEQGSITRTIKNLVVPPPPPPPPPGPVVTSTIVGGQSVPIGTMWQVTVTPTPSSVEFWADGVLLANDQMAPFGTTINLAQGTHDLGLCATVNGVRTCFGPGGVFAEDVVVTAAPAAPPAPPADPALTSSIADGATVARGSTWTVTTNPDASLVEFWANGVQIGTDTSEPYTTTINLPAGTHQVGICATTNGVRSCFGPGGVFATITVTDSTPAPPPTGFAIPAYRITAPQGGGFHSYFSAHDSSRRQVVGDGVNGDKRAIIMWSTGGGGTSPLYSGKKMYALMGYRMVTGWSGRSYDWHNQPNDAPNGWLQTGSGGGVSPAAIDFDPSSSRGIQYLVEPMYPNHQYRIMTIAEAEARRGQWTWLWMELGIGRRDSTPAGTCRIWVAGEDTPRVNASNIDTHWANQHQWTYWEGAYFSSGFPSPCTFEFAATRFGRTPQECYEDRPTFNQSWANGTGSTFTTAGTRLSTEAAIPSALRW